LYLAIALSTPAMNADELLHGRPPTIYFGRGRTPQRMFVAFPSDCSPPLPSGRTLITCCSCKWEQ
jgi:hypothetical protein